MLAYLGEEGFLEPSIGDWPSWYVAPILSVWAVESVEHPGSVGWWAVSGDFPTDYTSRVGEANPRQALQDIGLRWKDAAAKWADGKPAEEWGLRNHAAEKELAPLLAARAELFLTIATDDSNWGG